ncbi:MAG: bifunctional homocysteine S-methyltransferase/methylenetetrahydrofolate reductase [Fimbriimonadales bacterium]|nr:MAG: bifunctional homocysteine S-methyltransferase/methylenetetrahydrofolate reductase [Fimbriimonadales bacterium]CUU34282.1 homocysteine S-methyltransferase [Armatimonadetes bacterium GXS]
MNREQFRARLEQGVLIADGAIGTMLALRGVPTPYELANLLYPDTVRALHREYYEAGARLIETNTYTANRVRLFNLPERGSEAPPTYSLLEQFGSPEELVRRINQEAVRLAREAVGADALVFGSVGPVGKPLEPIGETRLDEAEGAFREQMQALLEAGVDGLILETFIDPRELELAIRVARELAPDLPLIASKGFVEDGETLMEGLPERFAHTVSALGVDAVGANCVVGPQRMLDIVRMMATGTELPLSSMPTPGLPQLVRGQVVYDIHPDYFGRYAVRLVEAGAQIVGGCCGTTPDHIRAVAQAVSRTPVKRRAGGIRAVVRERKEEELPLAEPSRLSQILGKERVIAVELDLPRGLKVQKVIEGARLLKEHGVHVIDISDGARARLRMNVIAISHLVQREAGIEVMMHFACRDRNLLAIQADLLGAHALGIRNVLAITGDPAQIGDYPTATSVFDVDAIGLVRILRRFNEGRDLAGNTIGVRANFTIAVAYNPLAPDPETERDRLRKKIEEGAHLVYTQPIFEMRVVEETAELMNRLGVPWLVGVLPLRSARHAEFMHNEVPGVSIPEPILRRMAEAPEEDALAVGLEIARRFVAEAAPYAQGVYLMPPAGSAQIALQVIEAIR